MNGSYPYHLKQRILGDRGHLSNKSCANYMSKFIGENTKGVILIHLSEENNRKEIAYDTFTSTIKDNNKQVEKINQWTIARLTVTSHGHVNCIGRPLS